LDDGLLARRAMSGDLDSFGEIYDRYFARVYDLAWRTLRDEDAAGPATESSFLEAMRRLPEGAKAESFASWMFGIAHRVITERAAAATPDSSGYEEAFGSLGAPDAAQLEVEDATSGDDEFATLVWESASALGPRDYALLDLHVRQDLSAAELAPILGMNKSNASTLLKRMRAAADDVMRDYVLARRHADDCADLQTVLTGANFPPYSDTVREAVGAHARACDVCRENSERLPDPLPIFASLAPVAAPMPLKGDAWRAVASAWPYRARESAAGVVAMGVVGGGTAAVTSIAGGGFGNGGGTLPPVPGTSGDGEAVRNRIIMFGTAAVVLLIIAFAAAAIISGVGGGGGDGAGASGDDDDTPEASRTAGVPGVSVDTATPEPTDTPRGTPSASTTPEVTPTPTEGPPSPVPPTNTPAPPPPPPPTAPPVNTPVPTPTRFSFD
jgi:RNA polymerase sigma factor (sigma-70 family)